MATTTRSEKHMKAAPMTQKPSFPLMKQGDIQNIYHLQMPRWLFTDPKYNILPLEAKVAYTFLLNRFQLSRLNGWLNDDGEVFIIYTRRSLASEMQVSYHKIIDSMKALTAAGLIWERRCGRGDANQIYLALVQHPEPRSAGCAPFVGPDHEAAGAPPAQSGGIERLDADDGAGGGTAFDGETGADGCDSDAAASALAHPENTPRSSGAGSLDPPCQADGQAQVPQEVPGRNFQTCGDGTPRSSGAGSPEVPGAHPSYKEKSHIEHSHTENSPSVSTGSAALNQKRSDGLAEQKELSQILQRCELWLFEPETAMVLENAVERLYFSKSFRIGDAVLPQANVRSRLWDLDGIIMQTVVSKLQHNQRNIKNSTAYTMAVIFNAICESQSDVLVDPYINSLRGDFPGSGR
jgi:hypothetical protein